MELEVQGDKSIPKKNSISACSSVCLSLLNGRDSLGMDMLHHGCHLGVLSFKISATLVVLLSHVTLLFTGALSCVKNNEK